MDSFAQIIDLWPSRKELAADLAVGEAAMYKWHERNSIPAEYWLPLLIAARKRRIKLKGMDLVRLAAKG